MGYHDILRENLVKHEQRRNKVYKDSEGYLTVGIGHNLSAKGVSDAVIELIYTEDVAEAEDGARELYPDFDHLSDRRKAILVELVFNMGINVMKTFINTNAAINRQDWPAAAQGLENSKWYTQVGIRGPDMVSMLKEG